MTGSRAKGATAERELARELVRLFAGHHIVASAVRTAPLQASALRGLLATSVSAADVTCDLLPDDHVEVKRQERVEMAAWCAQAERDANGRRWLVAWRQSRQPWRVTLPLGCLVYADGFAGVRSELVTLLLADFVAVRVAQEQSLAHATCPRCHGDGTIDHNATSDPQLEQTARCPDCNGTGEVDPEGHAA